MQGPDYEEQVAVETGKNYFGKYIHVVINSTRWDEDPQVEYKLEVDKEKPVLNGVAPQQVVATLLIYWEHEQATCSMKIQQPW